MTIQIISPEDELLATLNCTEFMEDKVRLKAEDFTYLTETVYGGDLNDMMQNAFIKKEDGLFYSFYALQTITEASFPPAYLLGFKLCPQKNRAGKIDKLLPDAE